MLPTRAPAWATRQVECLRAGLSADEFRQSILVLDEPPVGRRRAWDLPAWLRLKQAVAAARPDVIHLWSWSESLWAQAAARAAGGHRLVASQRHEIVPRSPLAAWQLARAARQLSTLVVNDVSLAAACARLGLAGDRLALLPAGVAPPDICSADEAARRARRAELQLPAAARLVVTVGTLRPRQRVKDLIWAADLLKVLRDDVHLVVLGDGPHRGRLERFCHQCRIDDHVHFLGRVADVAGWLAVADMFWLARDDAGQPQALLEALAAGLPAVAADVPPVRASIPAEAQAGLVPVGDRAAIARATLRLLDDADLARQWGAAGRRHVLAHYSAADLAARHAALYRSALGR